MKERQIKINLAFKRIKKKNNLKRTIFPFGGDGGNPPPLTPFVMLFVTWVLSPLLLGPVKLKLDEEILLKIFKDALETGREENFHVFPG